MISYNTIVIASAIGVLPVVVWTGIIAKYNRKHQRGVSFLMNIFFLGVLSAIPASILEILLNDSDSTNQVVRAMQRVWSYQPVATVLAAVVSSALVAVIEEGSKGIGVLLAVFSKRFRIHNDGLIFGALVGLAFAVTENGVYFASALNSQPIGSVSSIIILRFLLSTTAHVIYSGLLGKFLADARKEQHNKAKHLAYLKAFVIPVAVHMAFNLLLATALSWLVVPIIVAGIYGLWYFYNMYAGETEPVETGEGEVIY